MGLCTVRHRQWDQEGPCPSILDLSLSLTGKLNPSTLASRSVQRHEWEAKWAQEPLVQVLGTKARGQLLPTLGPGQGTAEAGPSGMTLHSWLCVLGFGARQLSTPPLQDAYGGGRAEGTAVGENSLQHVQKLLRPLELLAWLEPCGHMPDSDGLRT